VDARHRRSSRAVRRSRLPARPRRQGHPARGVDRRGRRRVRGDDRGALLQEGDAPG
jgi:hypothetical protein